LARQVGHELHKFFIRATHSKNLSTREALHLIL